MQQKPHTVVYRHRKENVKKCSLRGLEEREDFTFYTYPSDPLPDLSDFLMLDIDAPPLTRGDGRHGLFILDGTWRYAEKMAKQINSPPTIRRSIPKEFRTAYPRKQEDCPDPSLGLASIEAIYIAYTIMGWPTEGLLDHYYWKEPFLENNPFDKF